MGQRLAPVLAIAFMSKIEKSVLDRGPILYYRYIDDCLIICSTQEEVDICYDVLNRQSQNIKFTREKPVEDWLPFLNIQVQALTKAKQPKRWPNKLFNLERLKRITVATYHAKIGRDSWIISFSHHTP
ncbi:unnamed protein product [Haemonchus placei]|uniref:Reverse transcriptase domain-containing protein n=1 Tax=Haemonchus placei TaxID=6290 RepID=A0A0N4X4N5_HAEPC|nr:unnamed protein product [Haemonchus placei]